MLDETHAAPDALLKQVQDLLADADPAVVQVGDLVIELEAWRVRLQDRPIWLTPTEFRLLACLARRVGRLVSYPELREAVWHDPPGQGDPKIVTNSMVRLRKKLGEDPSSPQYIMNVRGVGYRLRNPQQWEEDVVAGGGGEN